MRTNLSVALQLGGSDSNPRTSTGHHGCDCTTGMYLQGKSNTLGIVLLNHQQHDCTSSLSFYQNHCMTLLQLKLVLSKQYTSAWLQEMEKEIEEWQKLIRETIWMKDWKTFLQAWKSMLKKANFMTGYCPPVSNEDYAKMKTSSMSVDPIEAFKLTYKVVHAMPPLCKIHLEKPS